MAGIKSILIREFNVDEFHKKVLEMEAQGYSANRETYKVTPEMDPESGNVIHLHTIEMEKQS